MVTFVKDYPHRELDIMVEKKREAFTWLWAVSEIVKSVISLENQQQNWESQTEA